MVADGVSLRNHAFYEIGTRLDIVSDDEKRRGRMMLFQGVENCGSVAVFVSGIKRQIEDFFVGIVGVVGVELLEIVGGCIGDRGLSLLLKAQPPVAFCGDREGCDRGGAYGS